MCCFVSVLTRSRTEPWARDLLARLRGLTSHCLFCLPKKISQRFCLQKHALYNDEPLCLCLTCLSSSRVNEDDDQTTLGERCDNSWREGEGVCQICCGERTTVNDHVSHVKRARGYTWQWSRVDAPAAPPARHASSAPSAGQDANESDIDASRRRTVPSRVPVQQPIGPMQVLLHGAVVMQRVDRNTAQGSRAAKPTQAVAAPAPSPTTDAFEFDIDDDEPMGSTPGATLHRGQTVIYQPGPARGQNLRTYGTGRLTGQPGDPLGTSAALRPSFLGALATVVEISCVAIACK